jgi:hypothetical protein
MGFGFQRFQTPSLKLFFPPRNRRDRGTSQTTHFPHPFALQEQTTTHKTTRFQCFCTTFWSHSECYHT